MVDHDRISNTLGKMEHYLSEYNNICVGVSGGSDSNIIVHMIATYFRQYLPKCHFVFSNTGLEYAATLRHLKYMEERYNITIDRIRGKSVITAIRENGVPILSKDFSKMIYYAKKHSSWAIDRITRDRSESRYALSDKQFFLAVYLVFNPDIAISESCCKISKKKPYHEYLMKVKADLTINGERRSEGGYVQ